MENKYRFGEKIVREAGAFLRQHLDDELVIEEKTNHTDLVTNVDKAVQSQLTEAILQTYPDDKVYGEESDERPDVKTGGVWVIDPIDGTTNFIVQKTDFAILLAYVEDGVGQFAFIFDVMNDKIYHGGGQFPACLNGVPLPTFQNKEFKSGLLAINAYWQTNEEHGLAEFCAQTLGTRCYGSAGISMSHVLTGRMMGYVSYICPWDYAAGMILGEKLGYSVVTLDGSPLDFRSRQLVMMMPTEKLEEVKRVIR